MVDHPESLVERARRLAESLRQWRDRELSRCWRACLNDGATGEITLEGQRCLADLRTRAKLFNSSISRLESGAIDRDEMLRMEGRREIVLRVINLLKLDPEAVAQFVEVDNGQA